MQRLAIVSQNETVRRASTGTHTTLKPKMAPEVGFEPTTNRLTADRSTTELLWNVSVGSTESHPTEENWLRGLDLNQRPSGYEPDELPGCSTPRDNYGEMMRGSKLKADLKTGKPNGESQFACSEFVSKEFPFFS